MLALVAIYDSFVQRRAVLRQYIWQTRKRYRFCCSKRSHGKNNRKINKFGKFIENLKYYLISFQINELKAIYSKKYLLEVCKDNKAIESGFYFNFFHKLLILSPLFYNILKFFCLKSR